MSNTWHLTLELSLKLYRVKDYRLHGVCSPPFYFITQDISPQKSPQTQKNPKKSRTLLSSTKSESKAALSECHVKGLARQHGFNSSTNRWRENIRSVGTFRPDKAASPKDTSTRSTLCQWLSQESGTLDKVGDETNHQNTVQEKLK